MRKKGSIIWPAIFVVALSLMFVASCAKEGLRGTPDEPGLSDLKEEAYPESGDLSKEDRIIWDQAREEADKEWADRLAREIAKLKAQHAKEMEMMTEGELRDQFEGEKIYFAFDSEELTYPSRVVLVRKAQYMNDVDQDVKLVIEGHCDERGSVEYNLALGQRRAEAAGNFLAFAGVNRDRLRLISYGKERPVNPDHGEDAWAENRRCEFLPE